MADSKAPYPPAEGPPPYAAPSANVAYPPPPGFAGPPPPTTVHFSAPTVTITTVPTSYYCRHPAIVDCPYCHAHVSTEIQYEAGAMAWIIFFVCFVTGFFFLIPWCLCWIPFVVDGCKNILHLCPNCHRQLAVVQAGSS